MLTIRQITDNTDAVIRGLEKKHFGNAKETIDQAVAFNEKEKAHKPYSIKISRKSTPSPNPSAC